ncbi:cytochrome o ubiquinol oxidase subunit I [Rhizobium sp. PRIMUS64]|uniref:cytochrome o ubiquinol oxidase subunit I n=1 Tax=Rhizobium sp. PRIMUS64 TaxID=2908925 RepID=UPI001FF5F099|nr:cytochrome o ubiquinol oxidase subunit I [Rhizobium sp. PRIMUS64]MCJ9691172.1 cytochrome o ubiquinol oxidase subunit I [Rhizobium sp. PRIMUS64]
MLGKLSWDAIPFNNPIVLIAFSPVVVLILFLLGLVTIKGWWPYLWREWITSVDHKRIGVMYVILALVMLVRGFADAIMMRTQQALAAGGAQGYLPPDHYDQIFSAHGTIMIFFVAMPFVVGLMNFAVPLQLGIRDVAFPVLNNVSFWLTAAGVLLINVSLVVGEFARTGWLAYPPLSETAFSPGVGVDYYLWSLQISGMGTLLSGINLTTTILKLRAPGMRYLRMPIFCWTALASNLLMVAAFPVLTATFAMLLLDRYLGFHFFTTDGGGNAMMYINLIWIWGHPEVYILILPAFGVFSEVVATFSSKPLFGYRSMVMATMVICILSFVVWLHHFFTMGAGANVNAFFGVMTMIIAVPTGVKVFNWLFTLYGGRIRFTTPVYWALGFMVTFVIGGMTGVLMAIPPADFVLHNSLFLIAHFHNVAIGGVVFGVLAGYTYWFPKAFGFTLDERLGKAVFWCWFIGFYLAFMPLYALGLMGATRRMQHYADPGWQPLMLVALAGAVLILFGIVLTVVQLVVSIRTREQRRDLTGDPWGGRTLEWSIPSPPPAWNFAVLPTVNGTDAYWAMKQKGIQPLVADGNAYQAIEVPRSNPTGVFLAFFSVGWGFAMIWHIWWMAILGILGCIAVSLAQAWRVDNETTFSAEEVAAVERARLGQEIPA